MRGIAVRRLIPLSSVAYALLSDSDCTGLFDFPDNGCKVDRRERLEFSERLKRGKKFKLSTKSDDKFFLV